MRSIVLALVCCLAASARAAPPEADCARCHGAAAGETYALSKHGVIARLTPGRAPGCADCHDPRAAHAASAKPWTLAADQLQRRLDRAAQACGHCHSPRYAREMLAIAQRSLAVAAMKLREAAAVVDIARQERRPIVAGMETRYALMEAHAGELWLGLVHQSPDHQWWAGQAALDGDLLRIKGVLGESRRAAK